MSARKFTIGLAAAAVALAATIGSASAGEVSASEILNALKPKGATRSLSGAAPTARALNAEDQKFLDTIRTKRTRSLSAPERDRVTALAKDKQSIDLEITFDYNSAVISLRCVERTRRVAQPSAWGPVPAQTPVGRSN